MLQVLYTVHRECEVAVIDGKIFSLWDAVNLNNELVYETVANALSRLIHSAPISDKFLHYERTAGIDKNFEQITAAAASAGSVGLAGEVKPGIISS